MTEPFPTTLTSPGLPPTAEGQPADVSPTHAASPGDRPGAAFGTQPRLEHEIRDLLHRRLRVFFLVGGFCFAALGLWVASNLDELINRASFGPFGLTMTGVLAASLLGSSVVTWRQQIGAIPLIRLRLLEAINFSLATIVLATFQWFALTNQPPGGFEGPGHQTAFLQMGGTLSDTQWFITLVAYGVFVPNTWRRSVLVVGAMALTSLAILLVLGLTDEGVRHVLPPLLLRSSLVLLSGAAIAVYGSFKIQALQREAFAARQEARNLGQYRLKERLGAGGMGEVYLAEHRLLKRPCAVKLIRPERAGDAHALERFGREVQATAQLTHPNTVEVYDYGHADDGTFYYVMEYLSGPSLQRLVEQGGLLPPARVVHFLHQLCGALREAHAAGLIHRDIKPGNVIVCRHGGLNDVVKLVDFGLVHAPPEQGGASQLTHEGVVLGTPSYMAPEQALGRASLDARSDLYSLGATAYFLLTGQPPFVGKTVMETLYAQIHDRVAPLSDVRADVPADLEAIVLRCLAKDPAQRFPDAEGLQIALGRCACAGGWTEELAAAWWRERAEAL